MNIPYQSIYDEAISDRVLQKVGSRKFSALNRKPSDTDVQNIKSVTDELTTLKKQLSTLLKKCKAQFKTLDKNSLKLKLKDTSYYKSYKQSLWANNISSSYSENIADVVFPGAFGKTIQEIQSKVQKLETTYKSFNYINYQSKIPKELTRDYLLLYLNLDNTSKFDKGLLKGIRLGITPANYDGFYRLHMTNSPPDAFKSATGGIGLGKYLYLAVIHHCGHGFTDGSSDDALKVWNHVVKKRKDVYSFIAQDEIGENYILAISIKVPKQDVLEILNKWIKSKWYNDTGVEKTFFGWLKYRKKRYGDEPIDLLDDGLYDLFKKEIEELNVPVTPVIQKNTKIIDKYEDAEKIVDISNLEWTGVHLGKQSWIQANKIHIVEGGYRLPTIQELYTLNKKNILSQVENYNTYKKGFFWSSSVNSKNEPWYLDSTDGYANISTTVSEAYIIFVREKQNINVSTTKIGNLEIKPTDERNIITFSDAVRNAPQGYRLPTIEELRIIYANKNRISGFILPKDEWYWYLSSTNYLNDNTSVSILNMDDGQEDYTRKNDTEKFLVRYVKDNVVLSSTKPSNTLSKIVIEKNKMTFDEAKRKYGDTLLKKGDLTEEIQDEIIGFFKNGNNANLLTNYAMGSKFYFWLDEESLLHPNSFKVCKYNPNNEDFNYFFNHNEVEYYVVHFKNKKPNNTTQSNTNPSRIVKTKKEGEVRLPVSIYHNLKWKEDNRLHVWSEAKSLEENGWRLPTIQELYTICSDSRDNLSKIVYWSNDIPKEEGHAWGVRFINGVPKVLHGGKKGNQAGVILVKNF